MRLPDPHERPWLTVAELASITGEGQKVIRAALDSGDLPVLRVGRYVRIPTYALLQRLGMTTPDMSADPAPTGSSTTTRASGGPDDHDGPTNHLRSA